MHVLMLNSTDIAPSGSFVFFYENVYFSNGIYVIKGKLKYSGVLPNSYIFLLSLIRNINT